MKLAGCPTTASNSTSGLSQTTTSVTEKRVLIRSWTVNWRVSKESFEARVTTRLAASEATAFIRVPLLVLRAPRAERALVEGKAAKAPSLGAGG
jgi:hypothetical protein